MGEPWSPTPYELHQQTNNFAKASWGQSKGCSNKAPLNTVCGSAVGNDCIIHVEVNDNAINPVEFVSEAVVCDQSPADSVYLKQPSSYKGSSTDFIASCNGVDDKHGYVIESCISGSNPACDKGRTTVMCNEIIDTAWEEPPTWQRQNLYSDVLFHGGSTCVQDAEQKNKQHNMATCDDGYIVTAVCNGNNINDCRNQICTGKDEIQCNGILGNLPLSYTYVQCGKLRQLQQNMIDDLAKSNEEVVCDSKEGFSWFHDKCVTEQQYYIQNPTAIKSEKQCAIAQGFTPTPAQGCELPSGGANEYYYCPSNDTHYCGPSDPKQVGSAVCHFLRSCSDDSHVQKNQADIWACQ